MFQKKPKLKRVILVTLAFVVASVLLFGGEMVTKGLLARKSMAKAVAIPTVKEYKTIKKEKGIELTLSLSEVDNLRETVEPLIDDVQEVMKTKVFRVKIEAPTSKRLAEVYYRLSFFLEEARNSGEYSELLKQVSALEEECQGDFRVYIGEEFLYIQLENDGDSYYSIIPKYSQTINGGKGGEG